MDTNDFINLYVGLLILQYVALGNATGTVYAFIASLVQNQIISQLRDALDLDTALGAQLNLLATYRGLNRTLYGAAPGQYMAIPEYLDPNAGNYFGLVEYLDPAPTWKFKQYNDQDSVPYTLKDIQLRTLIQLKAQLDSWDGTLGSLDEILYSFFGSYVNVVDNENMSMIYEHVAADPDPNTIYDLAQIANIFPHPAGVAVTFVEI
jgi:Protein of unknown function (DUF2612)